MDKNKEIQAELNDDNLIKLSHKRTGALKKLFKKVMDGVATVVSHVPGAKFFVPKALEKIKEREQVNEAELQASNAPITSETQVTEPVQEPKKQAEPAVSDASPAIFENQVSIKPEFTAEPKITETTKESETEKKPAKTIFPRKLFASKQKTEATPVAETVKKDEPTVQTSTPIDLDINMPSHSSEPNNENKAKEETKPKVSDSDHLKESRKQYGDLIKFNTWQEYFHSFSKEEVEKKNEDGTMLKGTDFASIRLDQAETIKRITQAEEAERQATISSLKAEIEDRITRVQANRDKVAELKQEITTRNKETAELNAANKKARIQVNSLNNESKEANAKIDDMDDIIGQLTNPDYQPKKKAETKKVDAKTLAAKKRVDEITKEVEKEFEAKKADKKKKDEMAKVASAVSKAAAKKEVAKTKKATKPVETEAPKEKKANVTKEIKPKVVMPQVKEASLADELSDFDSEKVETPKTEPVVLESTNPDYPGTITVGDNGLNVDWKNSPMTKNDNQDNFNMGFDNDTRAKIGQEAYEKFLNSNGSLSFDDAKEQVAEQYTQSKGRTR